MTSLRLRTPGARIPSRILGSDTMVCGIASYMTAARTKYHTNTVRIWSRTPGIVRWPTCRRDIAYGTEACNMKLRTVVRRTPDCKLPDKRGRRRPNGILARRSTRVVTSASEFFFIDRQSQNKNNKENAIRADVSRRC